MDYPIYTIFENRKGIKNWTNEAPVVRSIMCLRHSDYTLKKGLRVCAGFQRIKLFRFSHQISGPSGDIDHQSMRYEWNLRESSCANGFANRSCVLHSPHGGGDDDILLYATVQPPSLIATIAQHGPRGDCHLWGCLGHRERKTLRPSWPAPSWSRAQEASSWL